MAKKKLSRTEEFEVMKLVLDKFLWAGLLVMLYGLWRVIDQYDLQSGLWIMVGGGILFILFMAILIREYEFDR